MKAAESHPERHVAIEELDRAIVNLAARINAASYELLVLIRRFDERAGWLKWGFANCAEWLHWRCDLSMSAAREKVRVGHALKTLPEIAIAFSEGRLSYSKVRPLTRVATPDNELQLLQFALKTTAARVEQRCREIRCGQEDSIAEANRVYSQRSLCMRRDRQRGVMIISVELPLESGELIDKALDKARDDNNGPEFAEQSWQARQADALVAMARDYLAGGSDSSTSDPERYQVMIHVEQTALAEGKGRSDLPVESARRLTCDTETISVVEDEEGQPLSVGRKSRTIPKAIKRALWARDGCCRFPGCTNKRFVEAHHIQHWSQGGETSTDNLMLLCDRHHRLVHEGGVTIEKDYRGRWIFKRPDGVAVPHCGFDPRDVTDEDIHASDSEYCSNPSAEGLLTRVNNSPPH